MAFVISDGKLARLDRPVAAAPMAIEIADGVYQDYATLWAQQPAIRTVVTFLARNIAQLGLHIYRRVSDVDRERLTDHPLATLIKNPNPFTTSYRLVDGLVNDLGIYGTAYWVKVRPDKGGLPVGLLRLDPRRVSLEGENPFVPDAFKFTGQKGKTIIPRDQVVHFRNYNPLDPRAGISPIETLRRLLAEEYQATLYREQLWRNGARVSGYIQRPVDAPGWSKEARARFRRNWQDQYHAEGPNAGGTPILEDGMEFKGASVTPQQAQYVEHRKLTREEVATAYHIQPTMVGILDHASFSNISEQHKNLYQDTLGPYLQEIVQDIELQLLPDFPDSDGVYAEFNLSEKLRGSFEEQASQLQTAVGAPYMTRNEARARLNLPQIEGGDEPITPLNVLVGGQASPTDTAPDPAAIEGETP